MKEELFYLILTDEKFGNDIIHSFPGMYSYIISMKQNASKEHTERCKEKIWNLYETNDIFRTLFLNYFSNIKEPRMDGKVLEVKNKEEYMRLMIKAKTENWKYEGISVVETQENIKLYFY